jgi:hypothetical protein
MPGTPFRNVGGQHRPSGPPMTAQRRTIGVVARVVEWGVCDRAVRAHPCPFVPGMATRRCRCGMVCVARRLRVWVSSRRWGD